MSSDFEAKKEAFTFDLTEQKWRQVSDMACPKLVSSGQIYSLGQVYVFGGTVDQICEKYDPGKDEWAQIPSYKKHTQVGEGLFSYSVVLTR